MNLNQIHSITKKIVVALLGGFLLLFILFHASANLLILRDDDGAWYSAFCHFMGTNYIVKVFEVVLMLTILCHIIITLWLVYTNYKARGTVRYHERSKTKTHSGSKLMAWTGALILCLVVVHFCHFYFVKMDIVPGTYMVEAEELKPITELQQATRYYGMEPEKFVEIVKAQDPDAGAKMEAMIPVLPVMSQLQPENYSEDGKWVKGINKDQKVILKEAGLEVEPDFYTMARAEFKNIWMVILYLIFFVVLFIHMRHAFPSAFQTLGLNNYKYSKAIDVIGLCYAILVCLMFTTTVLGVLFFV